MNKIGKSNFSLLKSNRHFIKEHKDKMIHDRLVKFNPELAEAITAEGRTTLSEIQAYLDEHFDEDMKPKIKGPDVIIIDHISKLK